MEEIVDRGTDTTCRKCISVLVPTYNEEENVIPLTEAIMAEFAKSLPQYDYDITFIDNCSVDTTREKLEALCAKHANVRAIFNVRNFGQFNSPYYGICPTVMLLSFVACRNSGSNATTTGGENNGTVADKSYTYNTYLTLSPSNWNELTYQDNNDTEVIIRTMK